MPYRRFSCGAVAATAALVLAACGGGSGDAKESLTFTGWGGTGQVAILDAAFKPWAAKTGNVITDNSPTDYAKIRAQVEAGKVSFGVTEVEPNFAVTACEEGLLEKLPQSVQDAAAEAGIPEEQMNDCAVPLMTIVFAIGYNTDKYKSGDQPKTWAEFFDTDEFPGKRAFWNSATSGMFEAALLADGVKPEELYPLDIDRAFKKLDTIKDDIVLYDTGDQQTQMLSSGEAPLVMAGYAGRIPLAAADGEPVALEFGENLISYEQVVVPKGYKNADLAFDWMSWWLTNPEAEADLTNAASYGPVNPAALEFVESAKAALTPAFPANKERSAGTIDSRYWAENFNAVSERMNEWFSR